MGEDIKNNFKSFSGSSDDNVVAEATTGADDAIVVEGTKATEESAAAEVSANDKVTSLEIITYNGSNIVHFLVPGKDPMAVPYDDKLVVKIHQYGSIESAVQHIYSDGLSSGGPDPLFSSMHGTSSAVDTAPVADDNSKLPEMAADSVDNADTKLDLSGIFPTDTVPESTKAEIAEVVEAPAQVTEFASTDVLGLASNPITDSTVDSVVPADDVILDAADDDAAVDDSVPADPIASWSSSPPTEDHTGIDITPPLTEVATVVDADIAAMPGQKVVSSWPTANMEISVDDSSPAVVEKPSDYATMLNKPSPDMPPLMQDVLPVVSPPLDTPIPTDTVANTIDQIPFNAEELASLTKLQQMIDSGESLDGESDDVGPSSDRPHELPESSLAG
jgi:hypothetical protein